MPGRSVCEDVYFTSRKYEEVRIEFYKKCRPEQELIKLLERMSEVQKVTSFEGKPKLSQPGIKKVKQLKIELKPSSRTSEACERVVKKAGDWVYAKGCTHGS